MCCVFIWLLVLVRAKFFVMWFGYFVCVVVFVVFFCCFLCVCVVLFRYFLGVLLFPFFSFF